MSFIKFFCVSFLIFAISFGKAKDFESNQDFQTLENFLSKINTLEGDITQVFQGKTVTGHFAIKLPSKFRIEYNGKDAPYVMIVNGNTMTYYDKSLDQKSQVPTPKNIGIFFESSIFSLFNPSINITDFKSSPKQVIIKFEKDNGVLTGTFSKDNSEFMIEKLETEAGGEKMVTTFRNVKINRDISNKIFVINNKNLDTKFNF